MKEMMNMNKRLCAILLMTAMTVMAVAQTAQELLNDANAKYEAGQMDAALELYTQAANKGLAEAQYQLGKMYYLGESGSKDYSSASMWFKRAARQRHAKAEYGLATCYMNGDGLPVNYDQALMYMKASALRGYVPAQRKLAELYQKGVLVEADSVEAKRWRDMSDGKDVTLVPEFERPTKIIAQAPTASSTSTAPATTAPVAAPVNSVATTPAVSAVATAIADPPVGYSATILPPSERPDSLVKLMDLVKLSRTEQLDSLNQALMDSLTTTGVLNKRMIATIDSMMIADSLEVVRLERLRQLKLQVAQQAQRKKSLVVLPKDSEIQRDLPPSASTHWDVPLEALTLKQDDKVPAPVSAPVATPTDDASDVASAVTPAASPVNNTQDQIEEEMSQTNGAPVVRILYPEDQSLFHTDVVKLKYQLLAQGLESSTKITVMVDGVRQPDSRAVKQADMIEVDVPNRDCTVMLFAQNEKGNSIPAAIRLIRENVSEVDLPRLFAVVVGVGDYKDEKLLPLEDDRQGCQRLCQCAALQEGSSFH